jgi:hypothetical protein
MTESTPNLLAMTKDQLDDLFKESPAGEIPSGQAEGTAIIASGSSYAGSIAKIVHVLVWQGKVFDAEQGCLKNRITPFGVKAIVAKVYKGESWLDNKECVVLDYSKTSLVARWIRDEIRLIGPGLYLGRVYWGKKPLIHFSLKF